MAEIQCGQVLEYERIELESHLECNQVQVCRFQLIVHVLETVHCALPDNICWNFRDVVRGEDHRPVRVREEFHRGRPELLVVLGIDQIYVVKQNKAVVLAMFHVFGGSYLFQVEADVSACSVLA
ncbi:hypothetical protein OGAPHI_006573 [Ogataea philodendri]|uniref:Uncharacterized protein n=1 Tax=Ogataea philodendri TaxID=1378263 RepID=A0A9P8NXS1_9ASCO|nr:uncharacterized protein OGAPHI_006573 [Ogataea philodendri]KAH3661166.1 hypothetical protein OGAPHI_006573 [Ogataea philodendri]